MLCPKCQQPVNKFGKTAAGQQRFRCKPCKTTFIDHDAKPLGDMHLSMEKAVMVIKMLMEGCSIRSTERLSGVGRNTIMDLLIVAGERAKNLMESRIVDVKVDYVEVDEIWGFIGMKEKTRMYRYAMSDNVGDAWCYIGFEANTKLILSWHLGKRTPEDTYCFMEKLRETVADGFQMTTDGFKPYPQCVRSVFGRTADYGQLVKTYGLSDDDRRYSPPAITKIDKRVVIGNPNEDRICTSYVERNNLSIRTFVKRMTRLTCAFSKKWENHEAALCLYFAYFNFCWKHSTLKTTPAVAAGLTDHRWTVEELLCAV